MPRYALFAWYSYLDFWHGRSQRMLGLFLGCDISAHSVAFLGLPR